MNNYRMALILHRKKGVPGVLGPFFKFDLFNVETSCHEFIENMIIISTNEIGLQNIIIAMATSIYIYTFN